MSTDVPQQTGRDSKPARQRARPSARTPASGRLHGTTVVLTRAPERSAALALALRERGATVIELPCVRTDDLDDRAPLHNALSELRDGDVLVITSPKGADAVRAAMTPDRLRARLAALGGRTADRARELGFRVGFVPSRADGATLARELPLPSGRVLLARSDAALAEPVTTLLERGARVREIVAYRTVGAAQDDPGPARQALQAGTPVVVVASPSAVRGFIDAVGRELARRARFVAIGSTTATFVRERLGASVSVALSPSDDGLLEAIEACVLEEVSR